MHLLLLNLVIGMVWVATGEVTTEQPLPIKGSVKRTPEDGIIDKEDIENGDTMKCTIDREPDSDLTNNKDQTVKDEEWKWVRLEKNEAGQEKEVSLEGMVTSELNVEDAIKDLSGFVNFRCVFSDNGSADFRVDAGAKAPRLKFRVKKFEKSYDVVEKEDLTMFCEVQNRTAFEEGDSLEQGMEKLKGELNVTWYMWSEHEDISFFPNPEDDGPTKQSCTSESMVGTKWVIMNTTEIVEDDVLEPHIKLLTKERDGKAWSFKIENAVKDDRRGYKCVVYNISQPANCSEAAFFVRVKDKYAALWPFIGIVAEVVVLCAIIFICERGRNNKDDFEDEGLNDNGIGVGQKSVAGEKSNVRNRRQ